MSFDAGLDVTLRSQELAFDYGPNVSGPSVEMRRLEDIRASLRDPQCVGPDPVYGIAMDVCQREDVADLQKRYLLFGVVAYASGPALVKSRCAARGIFTRLHRIADGPCRSFSRSGKAAPSFTSRNLPKMIRDGVLPMICSDVEKPETASIESCPRKQVHALT